MLAEYVAAEGRWSRRRGSAWNNERGNAADRIPGLGLSEVMGARETAIETAPGGRTSMKWQRTDLPGLTAGTAAGPLVQGNSRTVGPAARVVARYEDGARRP